MRCYASLITGDGGFNQVDWSLRFVDRVPHAVGRLTAPADSPSWGRSLTGRTIDVRADAKPRNRIMLEAVHWGPASKATPKQLVVLCHGLGADAYDLIDLAPSWADAVPDALFASVNAPDEHYSGFGRQWWAVSDRRPEVMADGVRRAAGFLNAFIDAELVRLGLPPEAYALMGFSQGAMTVLFTGLRRPVAPRVILAFSGALIAPETLPAERRNKAPVLLVHGEADGQVPVQRSRDAEAVLKAEGVPVEALYIPGLGHGIDDSGIAMGGAALRQAFS
jgi:phospholipase/carboxylesterase